MIRTSRQLKDLIRNHARDTGIAAHILIRKYMMERFLERVANSPYRDCFILKGGLLVSAFVGVEIRTTMDIDTTIKGLPVSKPAMEKTITEICAVPIGDNVNFSVKDVTDIMEESEYNGIRFNMEAYLDESVTPLKIDISTGDAIIPGEILYRYRLMFENRNISIMTYPIETVLSEKIETIIVRSIANTRMRDFYDIHVLIHSQFYPINRETLSKALRATAEKRNSEKLLQKAEPVLSSISDDDNLKNLWRSYQKKFGYAAGYSWNDIMESVRKLCAEAGLPVQKT